MASATKEFCRMELLRAPLTTVFGIIFFTVSTVATIGNCLALIVIMKMKARRSLLMLIISSLAFSDLLVGTIVGPITGWQQVNKSALSNCVLDKIRAYFVVLLVGSSVMTLALISYDRYILLTKLNNYNKYMTKKKTFLLLAICWIVPALIPVFREVNTNVYLIDIFVLFVAPLVVLGVCYYFIMKAVNQKENDLQKQISTAVDVYEDRVSSQTISESINNLAKKQYASTLRKERKAISLAKTVIVLIICYVCCIIPINIWITLEMIKLNSKIYGYQVAYVIAMLCMQLNSCINPIIYFSKNPDFKRRLRKLFTSNRFKAK